MLKRNWALIALVYLALAEVLSLAPVPDLSLCLIQPEHGEQTTNHNDKKYCPAFHSGAALVFEIVDGALERHDKSVIGAFTIVLAISTIGLWLATNKLWNAGERQFLHAQSEAEGANFRWTAQFEQISAQIEALEQSAHTAEENLFQTRRLADNAENTAVQQLRAYVGVSESSISKVETGSPEAIVNIKNFGQTPAYDLRSWIHMWIAEHPLTVTILPDAPEDFQKSTSVLYPGSHTTFFMPKEPPVSKEFIPLLGTKDGTIYVYGRIEYRDAFHHNRTTNFRLMYGGSEPVRGNLLKHDRQGNESD